MNYPGITDLDNRSSPVRRMMNVSWSGPLLFRVLTRNQEEKNYKRVVVTKNDTKEYTDGEC